MSVAECVRSSRFYPAIHSCLQEFYAFCKLFSKLSLLCFCCCATSIVVCLFVVVIYGIIGYVMSANNGQTSRDKRLTTLFVGGATNAVCKEMVA